MEDERAALKADQAAARSAEIHRPRTGVGIEDTEAEPLRWIANAEREKAEAQ